MGIFNKKVLAVALGVAVAGCEGLTDLEVVNSNAPETGRALSSAEDTESLIGGTFLTYWNATQIFLPFGALTTGADENAASWGNWGMRDFSEEPRRVWNNSSSYGNNGVNGDPWDGMYATLSAASDGITAINDGLELGGAGGPGNPRALAYTKFVQGLALGWLALQFDQAIIFDENVDLADAAAGNFVFEPYDVVMAAALVKMNDAIGIAQSNSFTLDPNWINGTAMSNTELIQVINSFKARMRAAVARNPAERAAVDWNAVLAETAAGITSSWGPTQTADGIWYATWHNRATEGATWSRADYKTFGWADISGGYDTWLATPVANRQEFEMDTRDLRIWGCGVNGDGTIANAAISVETAPGSGQCRSADGSTSRNARRGAAPTDGAPNDQEPGLYFRFFGVSTFPANRGTYHWSNYHHWRWEDVFEDDVGHLNHILPVEMDFLRAEAYLQTGQQQLALDIINGTRTAAGLPALTLGNLMCPTVKPACTILDQLAFEKRMETWNTNTGGAFFDRRGWGPPAGTGTHHLGLVEGTPLHFPVPGAELEVLQLPTYTFGGVGNESAPIGTRPAKMTASYDDIYAFQRDWTVREKLDFIEKNFRNKAGQTLVTRYY